jgi:hypothetical protein
MRDVLSQLFAFPVPFRSADQTLSLRSSGEVNPAKHSGDASARRILYREHDS